MNAKIIIKSLIDGEEFLNSYDGSVTFQGDVTLLAYEELLTDEASSQTAFTSIRISPSEILLEKLGALSTEMHFLPGEKTKVLYQTPFGDMPMDIDCTTLQINQTSSLVTAEITYKLLNNNDVISTHELKIQANLL